MYIPTRGLHGPTNLVRPNCIIIGVHKPGQSRILGSPYGVRFFGTQSGKKKYLINNLTLEDWQYQSNSIGLK